MKKKMRIAVGAGVAVFLFLIFAAVILNRFRSDYEQLDAADQLILKEWNTYVKQTAEEELWKDFKLGDQTLIALKDSFGGAYLINPKKKVSSIFARKIRMPSDYQIEVYRIAAVDPGLLPLRMDGNFNTSGKTYTFYGNEVFFTKYDETEAITKPYSSSHYLTFLTHEAFHYYMQNDWMKGSTYSTDSLSPEDLELLYQEYEILERIQRNLLAGKEGREAYLDDATEYVELVKERMRKNPDYVRLEMERETVEGTATYVSIKASELAGYDYGVMYFDNIKDVPFSDLKNTVEAGAYDVRELADRIPYETGALLCLLMEQMEIPDWQETLNGQTQEAPVTLYAQIETFVEDAEKQ